MTILRVIKHNVRAGCGPSGRRRNDTTCFIKMEYCLTVGLSRNGRTNRQSGKYVMAVTHRIYGTEKKNCKAHHLCFLCYHDASSLPLQKELILCSWDHICVGVSNEAIRVKDIW